MANEDINTVVIKTEVEEEEARMAETSDDGKIIPLVTEYEIKIGVRCEDVKGVNFETKRIVAFVEHEIYASPAGNTENGIVSSQEFTEQENTESRKNLKGQRDKAKKKRCQNKTVKCMQCGEEYQDSATLATHMDTHKVQTPYTCKQCDKKCIDKTSLKRHLREHNKKKKYKCKICGHNFRAAHGLREHAVVHSGIRDHKCSVCDKAFTRRSGLISHQRIHSGDKPYECGICNRKFTQSGGLTNHLWTHSTEKPFSCPQCEKTFSRADSLDEHLIIHSGQQPYQCEKCNIRFSRRSLLRKHIRTHCGKIGCGKTIKIKSLKRFECDQCGKQFCRYAQLLKHIEQHIVVASEITLNTAEENIPEISSLTPKEKNCSSIEESNLYQANLNGLDKECLSLSSCDVLVECALIPDSASKVHKKSSIIASHKPVKTCNRKTFKNTSMQFAMDGMVSNLQDAKTETDNLISNYNTLEPQLAQLKCNICENTFQNVNELYFHATTAHNKLRPHLCLYCGMQFKHRRNKERHCESVHLKVKSHSCPQCKKLFTSYENMMRHTKIHTGVKAFSCDQCSKSFVDQYALARHVLIHNGQKTHECAECGRLFLRMYDLVNHTQAHERQRMGLSLKPGNKSLTTGGDEYPYMGITCLSYENVEAINCSNIVEELESQYISQ